MKTLSKPRILLKASLRRGSRRRPTRAAAPRPAADGAPRRVAPRALDARPRSVAALLEAARIGGGVAC